MAEYINREAAITAIMVYANVYLDNDAYQAHIKDVYRIAISDAIYALKQVPPDTEINALTDQIDELRSELKVCRNELCLRCGEYKYRHRGACDGCRWYEA